MSWTSVRAVCAYLTIVVFVCSESGVLYIHRCLQCLPFRTSLLSGRVLFLLTRQSAVLAFGTSVRMVVYLLTMRSGSCLYGRVSAYHAIKFLRFCLFLLSELWRAEEGFEYCEDVRGSLLLAGHVRPLPSSALWEF